jgi:hypothetical protein
MSGGVSTVLKLLVAANPPQSNPTVQATVSATGGGSSGGFLPAGNYFASYTFYDGVGETTTGSSQSASFTVATGNIPQVTLPALPTGASGINLYLTEAGGAAGTETLYATGITATTFNASYGAGSDTSMPKPPTVNGTGAVNLEGEILFGDTLPQRASLLWLRYSSIVFNYVSGYPVTLWGERMLLGRIDYTLAMQKEASKEIINLIVATPGNLKWVQGNVIAERVRVF